MAGRVAGFDWSATPLGPRESWPQSLQTALSICLSSRFPMLVWWGPQLTVFYNDAYLPLLGTKHPGALGQRAADTWSEAWAELGPMADGVLAGGEATFSEDQLLFLQRHGYVEETYWTFSYSPIHDESGDVGGIFVAVNDTTHRFIGERRLRALGDLGELSGASTGNAEGAGRAAVRVLGRHRASVPFALAYVCDPADGELRLAGTSGVRPGGPAERLFREPDRPLPGTGGLLVDGLRDDLTGWFEPGPLGDAVPDQALLFPIVQAGEDDPVGLLVLGVNPYRELDRDYRSFFDLIAGHVSTAVSDALAYQAERRRAEALAELDRAKTDFFSNVSHEFRTPLTLISGPVAELRSLPAIQRDGRLREELDVVARNAERLGKLVNTLLDFSRLQSGRIDARFEPVDLGGFTTELASVFRSAVDRAGLAFTVDCPPLTEPVYVDRDMWEKVLLNLLSNAVKYTFEGGITVLLRPADDGAVLTVADTGAGIPDAELPRLFERFHRVPNTRARSGEGSGIGLAMVRELVELHGGTVTADSILGEGTTFTVRLPWGRAHLSADQVAEAQEAASVSPAAEPFLTEVLRWMPEPPQEDDGTPGGTGGTVLVADDNADMREYLRRLLAPRYRVRTAGDGAAALETALADPPDLVVSDVMMPRLDGMQLLSALRAEERTARIPVVLLSARAGQDASVEALTAGADDYLVKPFATEELLARVHAHLQLGRVRREAEDRFRAMADLAPALIWVSEHDGSRVFLNSAWRQFTGRPAADDLGQGWRDGVHPDDRQRYLDTVAGARAIGTGWEIEFRLRRLDGAYHWLLERAVPLRTGAGPAGYVGSCTDINARYRETERQTLLASIGTALDREQSVAGQLSQLARFVVDHRLADLATVRQADSAGGLTPTASAAADAPSEAALAELGETWPAREVAANGRSVLRADVADGWTTDGAATPEERARREAIGLRSGMAVPLRVRGRVLAVLSLGRRGDAPPFNADDLALVEDIAARAALSVDNALLLAEERATAVRLTLLQRVTADLSAATTPVQVADAAAVHLRELIGETAVLGIFEVDHQQRALRALAFTGPHEGDPERWGSVPLTTPLGITAAVNAGRPFWLELLDDDSDPAVQPPPDVREAFGVAWVRAVVALPLTAFGRVVGVVGVGFAESRTFDEPERAMLLAVAEQCAQALDRARLYRAEQRIAETLQHSLLPQQLPRLARLSLAARYLPGAEGTQAGGDWYDVAELDGSRVAIAVGDVVGQGPAAAAVMGQLRSALSTALLQGHGPAEALEVLDRFAARLPGATASSAACLVVDWAEGEVTWARAGHLPPLLVEQSGPDGRTVRSLEDAGSGTVLGIPTRRPFAEGRTRIGPGASLLLYTDGLVERRDQPIDAGIRRVEAILRDRSALAPEPLATEIVTRALDGADQPDDVALIIARLLPAPLEERLPAEPARLAGLRHRVQAWAGQHALPTDTVQDLQLALGEAASNSVEHAYRGRPSGTVDVHLAVADDGSVAASVRDTGHWREAPTNRGFRGRGLEMIRELATDVVVDHPEEGGTRVRFRLPPAMPRTLPPDGDGRVPLPRREAGPRAGHTEDGAVALVLPPEIDLETATALRADLIASVAALPAGGSVALDLRSTTYLASAGLGLLLEVAVAARRQGGDVHVLAAAGSVPARVLAMAGLDSRLLPREEVSPSW